MSLRTERSRTLRVSSLALAALLAACGGGGGGDGYSGGGTSTGGGTTTGGGATGGIPNLEATFTSIQANVFTPICTACHIGATAPQGLQLDAASSYALLVGVASTEQPSILRVAPGNPGASYLIQKLEGTAAVGARMPLNGTPLVQSDINIIRQWITDGAQGPPAPPANNPLRVTSLSPVPESSATALPSSITAVFDRELNAATVTTGTFLVDRSGGDGSFSEGNEVAITAASITVPAANPSSAVFDMTGVTSVEDTYRVRLIGAGAANILDLGGNALDGEFSGAFPSGDGTAGGDFSARFVVANPPPTLASLQANVFGPRCAGCHTGPTSNNAINLPAAMDLTTASATFASLVGVASLQAPSVQRVQAGNPGNSYVVQKIEGTAGFGQRMPLGGPFLDQPTIDAIRLWISAGANQ
jgi:hypothetical protein